MMRWLWFIKKLRSHLWVRASQYSVTAVLTALASIYLRRFIPENITRSIGADAVDDILHILASSMLAVTIFSVSTMVTAYNIATSHVTPRAAKLLVQNRYSHKALSTFIGTFIFSIVGIVALQAGIYGESGRLILFVVTIAVIALIIVTLIRWIEYLTNLGQVSETVKRVEDVTVEALKKRFRNPCLGGCPVTWKEIPEDGTPVYPDKTGYIQDIDMNTLNEIGEKGNIYLTALPGEFVGPSKEIAIVANINTPETHKKNWRCICNRKGKII